MGQGEFSSIKTQDQLYQMLNGGKKASKHVEEKQSSLLKSELITKKKKIRKSVLQFKIIQAHSIKDENCASLCTISQNSTGKLEDLAKPAVSRNPSHTHPRPMDSLRQMSPCSFALALQSPAANSPRYLNIL